jgi:DNA topoisomerase-1
MTKGLDEKSVLTFKSFDAQQHFTQPAPHYTEASLVRAMEEQGIGRPSTYAPTITTILARRYVSKEEKNLYMTEMGEVVNDMMKKAFPSIVDPGFTANLESLLDGVAEGTVRWKTVIENFYPDLDEAVKTAEKELAEVKIADEETDEICDKCGRRMVIKYGPHGKFLACPGFPECRNTKPYFEKIGIACPKCGKDIVVKKTKKGRKYYGCMGNPDCDFMVWQKPSPVRCPECGSLMLEKGKKLVCWNPDCGHIMDKPSEGTEEQ